jgi:cytoskeletal protein CcmA (bactofilin family)
MRKVIFKALKASVMPSNAHDKNASRHESPLDSVQTDAPRPLEEEMQPVQPAQSFEPRSHQNEPAAPAAPERVLSVIGPSLMFKGDLFAEEDLLIQGRVEGSINHSGMNLTIGAHGDVKADIVAQKVLIQGSLHGNVRASEAIIVEASARVRGNLCAPHVGLREGATFKGSIDMDVALGGEKLDELLNAAG